MKYQNIVRAILSRPWAIDPDSIAWAAILDVLAIRSSGDTIPDAEIAARIEAAANGPRDGGKRSGPVAVIPVYGVLSPRMGMMSQSSGGTSAESISQAIRAAMADPEVSGIVLDMDTPGGNVEGIGELASEIRAARGGEKPIVAQVQHLAASAGYWLASAADEIVTTPSGTVGSIGVFAAHQDVSQAQEAKGIRTTLVHAGKFKVEGNQYEALSEEARATIQADVDAFYSMFVHDVAKGRGIGVDAVRSTYGEGRGVLAKPALALGMVDRIDSIENTVKRVARGQVRPRATEAQVAAWSETWITASAEVTTEEQVLVEPEPPEPEPDPEPEPAVAVIRGDLEIAEAAIRGGYVLPPASN